jgi:hypothetical protein
MTSNLPPAAVPGPDDKPGWEQPQHQQPDPFGDDSDEEGRTERSADDSGDERPKDDPRGE